MSTFKVGDKVRRICEPNSDPYYNLQLNRAYYIMALKNDGEDIQIRGNGTRTTCWWMAAKFEKVKPNPRKQ